MNEPWYKAAENAPLAWDIATVRWSSTPCIAGSAPRPIAPPRNWCFTRW